MDCPRDAVEAAAIVHASNGAYNGPETLTASTAPAFEGIAVTASEITGQKVQTIVMGAEKWIAAQVAVGQNEFMARFSLGNYQAAQMGCFGGVDSLLAALKGRAP